jgi:hypothetical protein
MHSGSEFDRFWAEYFRSEDRDVLTILGAGFDPRATLGLERLLSLAGKGRRDCTVVGFDEGQEVPSESQVQATHANDSRLREMIGHAGGGVKDRTVRMWSGEGLERRRNTGKSAALVVGSFSEISDYDLVVVDVSAMPRSVYFTIITKLLHLMDEAFDPSLPSKNPRLYVFVSEDPALDQRIGEISIDETAQYIPGFGALVDAEATAGHPRIWLPLLGEGHDAQLNRVWNLVHPDEICPVLPSPSRNPRRSEEILAEYRELLFDKWLVETRNIIYGSEQNPFDVYRQLVRSVRRYAVALRPLGGCKAVFSAHSSKLTSLGALMAAYELRSEKLAIGLAHVEPKGYDFASPIVPASASSANLVSLRLN